MAVFASVSRISISPLAIVKQVDEFGGGCYDTNDYGLDVVISPAWEWKDYGDPHLMVAEGRRKSDETAAVMRAAHEATADLSAERR